MSVQGTLTKSEATLSGHGKRVDCVKFHPCASDVIVSASTDGTVRVWGTAISPPILS
jgi:coronin-7